jgi:hypothetical protein
MCGNFYIEIYLLRVMSQVNCYETLNKNHHYHKKVIMQHGNKSRIKFTFFFGAALEFIKICLNYRTFLSEAEMKFPASSLPVLFHT